MRRIIVIATGIGLVLLAIGAYAATSNFFVSGNVIAHSKTLSSPATMSVPEFTSVQLCARPALPPYDLCVHAGYWPEREGSRFL